MVYALFLASLENRTARFFRSDAIFQKNSVAPIDFFNGRFLSEAKKNP
jgi:hypothetical protein